MKFIELIQLCGMENIYYISQIISAMAVVSGTIIALLQYHFNSKDAKAQRKQEMQLFELQIQELEKDRIQRAIDLAEYYKNNIIYYMNVLKFIYDSTGISEILENIPEDRIQYFDEHELKQNVCPNDIEKIRNIMEDKEFMNVLVSASATSGFLGRMSRGNYNN